MHTHRRSYHCPKNAYSEGFRYPRHLPRLAVRPPDRANRSTWRATVWLPPRYGGYTAKPYPNFSMREFLSPSRSMSESKGIAFQTAALAGAKAKRRLREDPEVSKPKE